MPAPGGFPGGAPFGSDPGATSLDPVPADLGGPSYGGPGVPDQPQYGGQEPQPAYGAAGDPPYGGQDQYGAPDQPQYGSREPSYGEYGSDPLGGRPAAGPPPGGRQDYDMPLGPGGPRGGDPRVSDPLGLPLGARPDEPAAPPPPPPAPAAPAAHGGSGTDTDGHKLPTVDELLQRIQSDRQRSAGPPPSADPLGDPLATGSYGTNAPSGGTGNTGPWPQGGQGGGYDPGAGLGAPAGYGQPQQQSDGYPTTPAYGESTRYDDPLGGGGHDQYGGSGGVYGDFSGSSYNGTNDPLAAPHDPNAQAGYADPNSTQAYNPGYYGGQQQGGYQGGQQNDGNPYGNRQPADDWENYRR
jgi:hypothetical protein